MHAKMKSLNTQLRKKGLQLVLEEVDPTFGPVYTIQAVKANANLTNSAVAHKMYYLGEVQKWSAARRKAIAKASKASKATKASKASNNRVKQEEVSSEVESERSVVSQ